MLFLDIDPEKGFMTISEAVQLLMQVDERGLLDRTLGIGVARAGSLDVVVNGADVMRPGIMHADPGIKTGDLVIVIEEAHRKALAIGRALIPGDEMIGDSGIGPEVRLFWVAQKYLP